MSLVALTVLQEYLTAVGISTVNVSNSALSNIEYVVAGRIQNYLGRTLSQAVHTQRFDIEDGDETILLSNFPLQTIVALTNDGSLVATADYLTYSDEGIIKLADKIATVSKRGELSPFFSEGKQTVVITFHAGYTTVPVDIQGVVFNMVGRMLGGSGVSSLSGERIGDYSYTRRPDMSGSSGGFTPDDLEVLNRYKPRLVFDMW